MTSPRPLLGIGLMLLAMAILPLIDVLAKFLGQAGLPILVVVWARALFGAAMTLPFALATEGARALRPAQPWHHLARAVLLFAATWCFFTALKYLPIADTLAIFFVNPLIVTLLSALVLHETVGPRRWAAVAVGFVGTLIIIRPGMVEINPGTVLALLAGTSLGSYFVMTRQIAGKARCQCADIPDQCHRGCPSDAGAAVRLADARGAAMADAGGGGDDRHLRPYPDHQGL